VSKPIDRITQAAIKVVREKGIEGTRMEDVALRAKVSRPNLYRYVQDRDDLVRLVVLHRAKFILHELKVPDGPWDEALVELFVKQVRLAARDEIFGLVVDQASPVAAKLLAHDDAVRTSLNHVISPILARGRAAGEIRDDLTDEEILYWLHYQTWCLARDPTAHRVIEIRTLARKFVVGGIRAPEARATTHADTKRTQAGSETRKRVVRNS
jgi:AcrR family transcriptional regulator